MFICSAMYATHRKCTESGTFVIMLSSSLLFPFAILEFLSTFVLRIIRMITLTSWVELDSVSPLILQCWGRVEPIICSDELWNNSAVWNIAFQSRKLQPSSQELPLWLFKRGKPRVYYGSGSSFCFLKKRKSLETRIHLKAIFQAHNTDN